MRKLIFIFFVSITTIVFSQPTSIDFGRMIMDHNISHSRFIDSVEIADPLGKLAFSQDGTKMYYVNTVDDYDDPIYGIMQYTMSPAWDISSLSYSGLYYDTDDTHLEDRYNEIVGFSFSLDGKKLYCSKLDVSLDTLAICQYNLSTAWNITTATEGQFLKLYLYYSKTVDSDGLWFSSNGLHAYLLFSNKYLFSYTLTTAWDISTMSNIPSIYFLDNVNYPTAFAVSENGKRFYILSDWPIASIDEYEMDNPWDITTAHHKKYIKLSLSINYWDPIISVFNSFKYMIITSNIWLTQSTKIFLYKLK